MPINLDVPVSLDLKTSAGRAWIVKLVDAINSTVIVSSTLFNDSEGNPANVTDTSADGTSTYAARRNHVHAIVLFNDGEGAPANIGTPADGSSVYVARRDHVHALILGAALTSPLTQITHTEPGTPDYAIANLTNSSPYGFASQDEGNTILKVIKNLQVRLDQLEDRFQALGSLP